MIQKTTAINPAGINLINVNNGNTRTTCEIYSQLIIVTSNRFGPD